MSILKFKKTICLLSLTFLGAVAHSQEAYVNIEQDEKIPVLLELKTELAKNSKLNDRYKVQLFYGDLDNANKVLKEYESLPYEWSASIEYETPNYKVWVGNFRNRLEADRALVDLKNTFPNAFLFKPDRK